MQITKFLSIPRRTQSTYSNFHAYLSYSQLLLSILTGLLLISFTVINQHVVIQSYLEVTYLFTVLIITKSIIAINYLYRIKLPKSRLQQSAKIDIMGLFIPGFIKSLMYFLLMVVVMYVEWILIVIVFGLATIGVQLLDIFIKNKKQNLVIQHQPNSHQHYSDTSIRIKPYKHQSNSPSINLKQIFLQILLLIALILNVQYFELVYNIQTVIAMCFIGVVCLLGFYYMHWQIFQLYQSDVDEVIAKQYPIELFNFLLFCLMYYLSNHLNSNESATSQNMHNNTSFSTNMLNLYPNTKLLQSPGFLFILEYPIHSCVAVCFSILYQYLSLQVIKKISFKYLFITQMTGLFWFNLYKMKQQQLTTGRYFSTFIGFITILMLTRFINVKNIVKRMNRIFKWFRNKKEKKTNKMVQQAQVK